MRSALYRFVFLICTVPAATQAAQPYYAPSIDPSRPPIGTSPFAKPQKSSVPRMGTLSPQKDQPILLEAAQMDYDSAHQLVIAEGKVEIVQGDRVLMADSLTYDQKNQMVFAQGNVAIMEPEGDVYFANEVELTEDLKQGVVHQMRARFIDNSLFAANEGQRISEDVGVFRQAVYSPCKVKCDDGSSRAPLWQVRADEAIIDNKEQTITYHDAYFDVLGVPVAYTPYLSHATPGADNKSGFLMPEYSTDNNLGTAVKVPFYWAIAKDRDATITLMPTTKENVAAFGEYRQRFDTGDMWLSGSMTRTDDRDALGNPTTGQRLRGHLFARGQFQHDEDWHWGFDVNRTRDDTYLRLYDISSAPILTSRAYGEGFNVFRGMKRSYVLAESLAFQGLQQQDDQRQSPLVLPFMRAVAETEPGIWGSYFRMDGNIMAITRDEGTDTRRISTKGSWTLPYLTQGGHVLELTTSLRADAYDVADFVIAGQSRAEFETRVIPEVTGSWRYPLMQSFDMGTLVVEPVVTAAVSPNSGNSFRIPNEDSSTPEFTDGNVFEVNRFPGYDRVETGPRVNYGVNAQLETLENGSYNAMFGQAYRVNEDPLFPLSNDIRSHFSDYVGRLGMEHKYYTLSYQFRMDKDNASINRGELRGSVALWDATLSAYYATLDDDPIFASREDASATLVFPIGYGWTGSLSSSRDLQSDFTLGHTLGLQYQNECTTFILTAMRNYTQDREIRPSTSIVAQVFLKNLN